ncbi:hypothetical protein LCGC14_0853570 [marine sediment metagenome]|uniref:Uncharacterized protein n=1 Tax=marine sediment metagenome TaxID=412755 RepID=A0A0F9P9J6_9ZZZZ|nr:MAG: hypothetical protein Lokiarch_08740 [Candidatus Lokiarchaeum sp. GC14_75]
MSVTEAQEDLEEKIRLEAYYISEKKLSYNNLCWSLAEKLIKNQGDERNTIDSIKKKGEEIFNQHNSADELCWQIAKLTIVGMADESNYLDSHKDTKPQEFKEDIEEKLKFTKKQAPQVVEHEEVLSESEAPHIVEHEEVLSESKAPHIVEHEEELSESEAPHIVEHKEESSESQDLSSKQRLACPKCGAFGHNLKSVDDKSKVLSYMGSRPIYRKKYACRNCGEEFR